MVSEYNKKILVFFYLFFYSNFLFFLFCQFWASIQYGSPVRWLGMNGASKCK